MENKYRLTTLYIYLTRNCNLHCKHCWQSAGGNQFQDLLSENPEMLLTTLRKAKEMGLSLVKISGGEPFLKKDLLRRVLAFCAENNVKSMIETNGTLLEETDLEIFSQAHTSFGISLDYLDAKQMDIFREGKGLVKKVSNVIKLLVKAGNRVQVIMALTKDNINVIEDMIRFCKTEGVGNLKINPVAPSGRANELQESGAILNAGDLLELSEKISYLENLYSYPVILEVPPAFRGVREYHLSKTGGKCNVLNLLGILADGSVSICAVGYEVKSAILGSILDGPDIGEIWELNSFLQTIREGLPEKLKGICSDCIFKRLCYGACRARLLEAGMDFFGPFPLCAELAEKGLFPSKYRISILGAQSK
jgi:SynChlorMet cassette radical SAM/SPASM protein ScmF